MRTGRKMWDNTLEDQGETIEILSDTDAEEQNQAILGSSPSSSSSPF